MMLFIQEKLNTRKRLKTVEEMKILSTYFKYDINKLFETDLFCDIL